MQKPTQPGHSKSSVRIDGIEEGHWSEPGSGFMS
jgi:hypothetical protein